MRKSRSGFINLITEGPKSDNAGNMDEGKRLKAAEPIHEVRRLVSLINSHRRPSLGQFFSPPHDSLSRVGALILDSRPSLHPTDPLLHRKAEKEAGKPWRRCSFSEQDYDWANQPLPPQKKVEVHVWRKHEKVLFGSLK